MQRIAIAVVEYHGRFLVGRRGENVPLAGYSEFPGGKCLPDEDAAACAVRECLEETGLRVTADRPLMACRHEYPHGLLDLEFWLCRSEDGGLHPAGNYEWVAAESLQSLRFPEANRAVIQLLTAGRPFAT